MPNTVVAQVKYEVLLTAALISYCKSILCSYNKTQRQKLCFSTNNSNKRKNVNVYSSAVLKIERLDVKAMTLRALYGLHSAKKMACLCQNSQHRARYAPPSTNGKISLHCASVTWTTRSFLPQFRLGREQNPHSTVVHPVPSLYTDYAICITLRTCFTRKTMWIR